MIGQLNFPEISKFKFFDAHVPSLWKILSNRQLASNKTSKNNLKMTPLIFWKEKWIMANFWYVEKLELN